MNREELSLAEIGVIVGEAKLAEYQAEAEARHGGTYDWKISQQRTETWSSAAWAGNKQRFEAIDARLAEAVRNGTPVASEAAKVLVAAHRDVLSEFFPVSPAKHYVISRSYIADERFMKYYENQQPGLSQWLADAIEHVAAGHGVDLANPGWV